MVEYLFWVGALALLGLLLAADYTRTRFRHTPKSRRVLIWLAAACYAACMALVELFVRPGRWLAAALWSLLAALPLYVLSALVVVERWRRRKLVSFDRSIRELRRELARRHEAIDRLAWEIRDLERVEMRHPAAAEPADASERLRERVTAWEAADGLARVRSLKVAEWRAELEGLDDAALAERAAQLEAALARAGPDRREQLDVQFALTRLARRQPVAAPAEEADGLAEARRRQAEDRSELERLQSELDQWQRERAAFVRGRITLD